MRCALGAQCSSAWRRVVALGVVSCACDAMVGEVAGGSVVRQVGGVQRGRRVDAKENITRRGGCTACARSAANVCVMRGKWKSLVLQVRVCAQKGRAQQCAARTRGGNARGEEAKGRWQCGVARAVGACCTRR